MELWPFRGLDKASPRTTRSPSSSSFSSRTEKQVIHTLLDDFIKWFSLLSLHFWDTSAISVALQLANFTQAVTCSLTWRLTNAIVQWAAWVQALVQLMVIYLYKVKQVQQERQYTRRAWYFGGQEACLEYRILTSCRTETWNLDSCPTSQCLDRRMII